MAKPAKSAFEINYVLMCDDVRSEDNGKLMIVGLYGDSIVLPKDTTGFVGPLTFLFQGRIPPGVPVELTSWIEGPAGDRNAEGEFGVIRPPEGEALPAQIIWRLFPWRSGGFGRFKVHVVQDGRDTVVHEFGVEERN